MSNIAALRAHMKENNLDALLVPRTDEYQSEYLAPCAERLAWLSGFTGSAGLAIIRHDCAAIFVDGRYTIQVKQQTDSTVFDYESLTDEAITHWLKKNSKAGERVGYDGALHTPPKLKLFASVCDDTGAELVSVDNAIDQCWHDRPEPPATRAVAHLLQYSGESSASKRERISQLLREKKLAACIVTMPDCVAWLLNVRGEDTPCVPVVLSKAIIYSNGNVDWCIDAQRIAFSLAEHCGEGVQPVSEQTFKEALRKLAADKSAVMLDHNTVPANIVADLAACTLVNDNLIVLEKACKNTVEVKNAHAAHIRDGVALANFFCWLQTNTENTAISELTVVDKLLSFRKQQDLFRDNSFETISAFAENAALAHYRVTAQSNKTLAKNNLFLLDSGAQYLDGTTDVTRTVAIGEPSAEQKDRYTRVLQGHISLATCCFPEGTTGHQLDVLARRALWDAGLDYAHGTGHGVGSYLGVHEGPQSIGARPNTIALKAGMILSNEPAFYQEGEYGLRIENLVVIKKSQQHKGFLTFENLTMVPIAKNLIDLTLLSPDHIDWLNNYHKEVYEKISPHLTDSNTLQWLRQATSPV